MNEFFFKPKEKAIIYIDSFYDKDFYDIELLQGKEVEILNLYYGISGAKFYDTTYDNNGFKKYIYMPEKYLSPIINFLDIEI